MKKMKFLLSFLMVGMIFIFSCSAPKIMYDYDRAAKFSTYKTFDFYPEIQLYMNQLDSSRVIEQVENVMLLKGFIKSTTPDVYVNIVSEQFETPANKV